MNAPSLADVLAQAGLQAPPANAALPPAPAPVPAAPLTPQAMAAAALAQQSAARVRPQPMPQTQGPLTPQEEEARLAALRQAAAAGIPMGSTVVPTSQLTQAPGPMEGAPGGPTGAGPSPGDAALSGYLAQGGQKHQAGLSPADKNFMGSLQEQGDADRQNTALAHDQIAQIASDFAKQSDAVASDGKIAAATAQQQLQDNAARRASLEAETKQRQAKIQSKLDELEAQGVNPNHYWQDQSTGQKVMAGITVALGGFAAGLNPHLGGHNAALDIINGAIERDVEAQKTNLMAHLSVLDKRMGANAQGFDQRSALLNAERDSIQTGYTIASNELSKRMAAYQGNADLQQKGAQLGAALTASASERIAHLNEQIYGVQKRGESVVATSGPQQKIIELSQKLAEQAANNGVHLTPEQARGLAANYVMGRDVTGGMASTADIAKPAADKESKAAGQIASLEGALGNIDQLIQMRSGAGVIRGADANAKASALSFEARAQIAKGLGARMSPELLSQFSKLVPEDPLEHNAAGLIGQDPTASRLQMARQSLANQLAQIRANPGSASSGDDDNPAGGKAED